MKTTLFALLLGSGFASMAMAAPTADEGAAVQRGGGEWAGARLLSQLSPDNFRFTPEHIRLAQHASDTQVLVPADDDVPDRREQGCWSTHAQQVRFKLDNDLVVGRDYGYSAGVMLEVASRTPAHDGSGAIEPTGLMCGFWRLLGGGRLPSEHMSVRIDTAMYTPELSAPRYLLVDDRPYAATLMLSFTGTRLADMQRVRNEVRLGWVGPALGGESIQNSLHRVINAPQFNGWDNQLGNEPLLEWAQYRQRRWHAAGAGHDVLGHWGLRLGNLQTSAFAGVELRWGSALQDDGGSAPLLPGSNEVGDISWNDGGASRWDVFLTAGVRAVARDLSLDGNAFRDSHSVDRKPLVVDGGAGVSYHDGPWSLKFMWLLRSREFEGQKHPPSFGSLLISYAY